MHRRAKELKKQKFESLCGRVFFYSVFR